MVQALLLLLLLAPAIQGELMDSGANGAARLDDDRARHAKRVKLKQLNSTPVLQGRSGLAY